jgi:hypothetical protein
MNPIDLTWLSQVKAFCEVGGSAGPSSTTKDDAIIAAQITAFSQWVLTYCSRETLNSVQSFTEVYDGNGSDRIFLRNSPIQSITSVQVGALSLPLSSSFLNGGVFIEQSKRSIGIRRPAAGSSSLSTYYPPGGNQYFAKGLGNIQVVYTAGYPPQTQTQELETIAAQTVPLVYPTWVSDLGVLFYPSLVPMVLVGSNPATGQYSVSNGTYVFAAADNGKQVLVSYTYNAPPADLEFACRRTVGTWYKRRGWIDQSSKELHTENTGGTTRYQSWPLRPEDRITINSYKRYALV